MTSPSSSPVSISLTAPDGYLLGGQAWIHSGAGNNAPVVIINCATAVLCRYYSRFAHYLHDSGFNVLTYDYRGIGLSRQGSISGLRAGWLQWGELDFEAMLQFAEKSFPQSALYVVGHSVGGVLIGLAPSSHRIAKALTVGAQHAYWPDYLRSHRLGMHLRWHLFMPLLTRVLGYFPGKRLGWLEDVPTGVVRDWVCPHEQFVDTYRYGKGSVRLTEPELEALRQRFANVGAPIMALSFTDDPYGTVPAIERLLDNFSGSRRAHLRIDPAEIGVDKIGHFAYFHTNFRESLWPLASQWLCDDRLADRHIGNFV